MIELSGGQIMSPMFVRAFNDLCDIKTLPAVVKYDLAKMRKSFAEETQSLVDASKSLKEDEFRRLLQEKYAYPFKQIDSDLIAEDLSATELCVLEPLLANKEEL